MNAGSGAARVVVDGVVPALLVDVVCAGVVAVLVVFAAVAVDAVCVDGGALDAVTVFVDEPHAASSAAAHAHSAAVEIARVAVRFIVPWYSPPELALLACVSAQRRRDSRRVTAAAGALGRKAA